VTLKKINSFVEKIEEWILKYGIIILAVLTVGNVISRRLFNQSWAFTTEASQFLLVLITFMGISYGVRKGRHIRMTALYDSLNEKWQKIFMIIISSVTAVILFFLAYHSARFVISAFQDGRVTPALQVPFYLVIMWAPIGLILGGIQYFLTLIKNLTSEGVWLSYEEKEGYKELDYVNN